MTERPRHFAGLRAFVDFLEARGELLRVSAEVDPRFEVSELTQRVIRQGGPALLFERVRGADFPLVMNLYGSARRMEFALGRPPREIGLELIETFQRLNPPSLERFWALRHTLLRARFLRPRLVRRAPVQEVVEPPRLDRLPNLWSWPRDAGPFITFGPTLTHHPGTGARNFGLYRLQLFDPATTGMHWQSMKGGRGHYHEAERLGQGLEAAVVLGGDPMTMLSAILPLPEDFDELGLAGFLRGRATELVRARSIGLAVPANADFVLEGTVPAGERRMEGPFGDHYGHYSEASPFPVFHVKAVTRRRDAIYPGAVVGKPPQEDKWIGIAAGEMIGPLIRVVNPNIVDLYANDDAVFHNLLTVAVRVRHPLESFKTALNLLGTGQLALTKCVVMVRPEVPVREFGRALRELWHRFDPRDRMLLLPIAPLDTLDYTSFEMHVGSKLVLDATGEVVTPEPPPTRIEDPSAFDRRITAHRVLDGGFVVVQVRQDPREVLAALLRWEGLGPAKFVAAVSDDVDLADEGSIVWGIFTRFDPARDLLFARQEFIGAKPVYGGRMAIDATWKVGYPPPVTMPEDTIRLVERRWGEYFGDRLERRERGAW